MATAAEVVTFIEKVYSTTNYSTLSEKVINTLKTIRDEADKMYYASDKEWIPDYVYDKLNDILTEVGHPRQFRRFGSADHQHWFSDFLGTLDKAKNIEEFIASSIYKKGDTYFTSPKVDGNSVAITFDLATGNCIDATTRGKDGNGKDLMYLFNGMVLDFSDWCPDHQDKLYGKIVIKFEAAVRWSNLVRINDMIKDGYASCRSAITGILSRQITSLSIRETMSKLLSLSSLVMLDFKLSDDACPELLEDTETKINRIRIMHVFKAKSSKAELVELPYMIDSSVQAITKYLNTARPEVFPDFQLDGIVVENLEKYGSWNNGVPDNAIAIKFPPAEGITTINSIEFSNGKGGRITPVVNFQPVVINGHEYTNTAILSYKRWKEMTKNQSLGKGTTIKFSLLHDVMGYIEIFDDATTTEIIPFPEFCPNCVAPLEENVAGNLISCINPHCECNMSGRAINFLKNLGVKGIEIKSIDRLLEAGIYDTPLSFVKWVGNPDKFKSDVIDALIGMQEKSVDKILKELNNAFKDVEDYKMFAAFNINGIGPDRFSDFCRSFDVEKYVVNIISATNKDTIKAQIKAMIGEIMMTDIPNWGSILKANLCDWISKNLNLFYHFSKFLYTKKSLKFTFGSSLEFNGMSVCVTGSCMAMKRKDIETKLKELGVKVAGTVSKKTRYLISDDLNNGHEKLNKAKEYGTPTLTSKQAVELFNLA